MRQESDPVAGNLFGLMSGYWHGQDSKEIYRHCVSCGKGCERCRDGWYKPSKSSEDPCIQCDFREDTAGVEGSDGPEDRR